MSKTVESRIGRRMQHRETLIGSSPRAARRRHDIHLRGRTVDVSAGEVHFDDNSRLTPGAVIWATGFALDHSFVHLPVFDAGGRLAHRRGVTAAPGLYFLGLPWQHTRGSALLGWVKADAEHIAQRVIRQSHRIADSRVGKPERDAVDPTHGGADPARSSARVKREESRCS